MAISESTSLLTVAYIYLLTITLFICYRLRRIIFHYTVRRLWEWMCDSVLVLEDSPGLPTHESTNVRVRDYAVSTGASHRYHYMPHNCEPGDLEADRGRYIDWV